MLNQSDIFRELLEQREAEVEGGWTTADFARNLKVKGSRAREMIREGLKNGSIVTAGRRNQVNCYGVTTRVPAYLFTNAATTQTTSKGEEIGTAPGARVVPRRRNG